MLLAKPLCRYDEALGQWEDPQTGEVYRYEEATVAAPVALYDVVGTRQAIQKLRRGTRGRRGEADSPTTRHVQPSTKVRWVPGRRPVPGDQVNLPLWTRGPVFFVLEHKSTDFLPKIIF